MPELVEYHKLLKQVKAAWTANRITHFTAPPKSPNPRKYVQGDWSEFVQATTKADIARVNTCGKNLLVHFQTGNVWQIHLSSTGWFTPANHEAELYSVTDPIAQNFLHRINDANVRMRVHFEDGQTWNYHDPRTWGKWWARPPDWCPPETPEWINDYEKVKEVLLNYRSKRRTKDVLCDQKLTAGIGNYISCEVLWRSQIHPHTPWNRITEEEKKTICEMTILFINASLRRNDHTHWAVFTKAGTPCRRCTTETIAYVKDGPNRGSYYCPRCQAPRVGIKLQSGASSDSRN